MCMVKVIWCLKSETIQSQGRSKEFSRGTHNFPNPPAPPYLPSPPPHSPSKSKIISRCLDFRWGLGVPNLPCMAEVETFCHVDVLFYFVRGSWGRRVDYQRRNREVSVRQRGKSLENVTQGRSWSGWKNLERNQFLRKHYERKHGLCGKIWLDFFSATWKWNTI